MTNKNAIATKNEQNAPRKSFAASGGGVSFKPGSVTEVLNFAKVMAQGGLALPSHLRDNPGACMSVAIQAFEWNMNPFAVANKTYFVNDRIAFEAQLIAAVINTRSKVQGRLKYEYSGEGQELKCSVTGKIDGEDCVYDSPILQQIHPKNSPLWKSDPRQQLAYYSARAWGRRYVPEVILGVYDRDEVVIEAAAQPQQNQEIQNNPLEITADDADTLAEFQEVKTEETEKPAKKNNKQENKTANPDKQKWSDAFTNFRTYFVNAVINTIDDPLADIASMEKEIERLESNARAICKSDSEKEEIRRITHHARRYTAGESNLDEIIRVLKF